MHKTLKEKLTSSGADLFFDQYVIEYSNCDDGWYYILNDLFLNLTAYLNQNLNIPQVFIYDVKQKFGILFINYTGGDPVVKKMIRFSERLSYQTCEVCGRDGELHSESGHSFGDMKTVCSKHRSFKNKEYKKIVY